MAEMETLNVDFKLNAPQQALELFGVGSKPGILTTEAWGGGMGVLTSFFPLLTSTSIYIQGLAMVCITVIVREYIISRRESKAGVTQ